MTEPRPSRRAALAVGALGLAAAPAASAPEDGPRAALLAFLKAFEACDLPAMEAAFDAEATSFDRTILSPVPPQQIRLDDYLRRPGMPAGMRRLAQDLPRHAPGPPYQDLTPHDLMVQARGDMAVCSFHLLEPHALSRRTVVLVRRGGTWKILHIHASNVRDAG